ncbi:uncharacterized protein CANTADRAFT_24450 [Suhomyces tanzawaensis NRRL Y-17324]|uniref:Uncharacterized protein n=1 Tax=Suhomyces tanzawaensis NRRL Y-17324 TaxID=984487 RepID=A0A1E4SPW4_9ASCO|nr:uncharacterized protein CANTADRAFT_24450 [Suhomyces tanzawaensis NRRL Y-17324]ODV81546.1 hypothetical protein CANTADRAFT_24450 [Suhomyces tanzawaensis NRRL Y-17324]
MTKFGKRTEPAVEQRYLHPLLGSLTNLGRNGTAIQHIFSDTFFDKKISLVSLIWLLLSQYSLSHLSQSGTVLLVRYMQLLSSG